MPNPTDDPARIESMARAAYRAYYNGGALDRDIGPVKAGWTAAIHATLKAGEEYDRGNR